MDGECRDQPGHRHLRERRRLWGWADRGVEGERRLRWDLLAECGLRPGGNPAGSRIDLHRQAAVESEQGDLGHDLCRGRWYGELLANANHGAAPGGHGFE